MTHINTPRLNLGCGQDHRERYHNVDVRESVNPDQIVDLDDHPWPWPDNRFEHVLASNVLEHLDDQLAALEELYRVTAPGGEIDVRVPHPASRSMWVDPTHENPLVPETFEHDVAPNFEIVDVSCSRVRFGRVLPQSWALWWADHFGHIVDEMQIKLRIQD
jgi:SAM-dependent methyltransferase